MSTRLITVLLVSFAALVPASVHAQAEADVQSDGREFFMPYFLAPQVNGEVGIGPASTNDDVSPPDVFGALQFGIMGDFMASKGPWAFNFNGLYMDLSKDGERLPVEFSGDQGSVELTVLRKLTPAFHALAGGRVNWIGLRLSANNIQFVKADETWFDPFIGARVEIPSTGKWRDWGRGDVGGFGVGSKFARQARAGVGFRASKLIELTFAYWVVSMDYENTDAALPFTYDVTTFGPELGIGFHV
jgi:hypothetical protein